MYIIISIIAGATTTISNTLNSGLGKKIGKYQGALVNFLTGLTVSIIYSIINYKTLSGLLTINTIPFYLLLGGVFGCCIVSLNNFVMPKIPVIYVSLLVFIGQIITGSFIDKILFDSLSIGKLIGVLFISIGLYINILIDKKKEY